MAKDVKKLADVILKRSKSVEEVSKKSESLLIHIDDSIMSISQDELTAPARYTAASLGDKRKGSATKSKDCVGDSVMMSSSSHRRKSCLKVTIEPRSKYVTDEQLLEESQTSGEYNSSGQKETSKGEHLYNSKDRESDYDEWQKESASHRKSMHYGMSQTSTPNNYYKAESERVHLMPSMDSVNNELKTTRSIGTGIEPLSSQEELSDQHTFICGASSDNKMPKKVIPFYDLEQPKVQTMSTGSQTTAETSYGKSIVPYAPLYVTASKGSCSCCSKKKKKTQEQEREKVQYCNYPLFNSEQFSFVDGIQSNKSGRKKRRNNFIYIRMRRMISSWINARPSNNSRNYITKIESTIGDCQLSDLAKCESYTSFHSIINEPFIKDNVTVAIAECPATTVKVDAFTETDKNETDKRMQDTATATDSPKNAKPTKTIVDSGTQVSDDVAVEKQLKDIPGHIKCFLSMLKASVPAQYQYDANTSFNWRFCQFWQANKEFREGVNILATLASFVPLNNLEIGSESKLPLEKYEDFVNALSCLHLLQQHFNPASLKVRIHSSLSISFFLGFFSTCSPLSY